MSTTPDSPPDPAALLAGASALLDEVTMLEAGSALQALTRSIADNGRRERAGHPPVPCLLGADEARALGALVIGMAACLPPQPGKEGQR